MKTLRFTLVSDGSSDRVLLHPLKWLCDRSGFRGVLQAQWADLRGVQPKPSSLVAKIRLAVQLYSCDLLFVHRDSENCEPEDRRREVRQAVSEALAAAPGSPPHVCIVPVRMTEAWLLFDEAVIRRAAGNPTGREPLSLPPVRSLESVPDPKQLLFDALDRAADLPRRRRGRLSPDAARHRIGELIHDWEPLMGLNAFRRLEEELRRVLRQYAWSEA